MHLFRLPAHMERQLGDIIRTEGTLAHCTIPETPAQLIEELEVLAVQETPLAGSGPRLLGAVNDLSKPTTLHKLAALYAYAARQGERIYPYFEAAEHA